MAKDWDDLTTKEKVYGSIGLLLIVVVGTLAIGAVFGGGGNSSDGPHRVMVWFENQCHDTIALSWQISPANDFHHGEGALDPGQTKQLADPIRVNETHDGRRGASISAESTSSASGCRHEFSDDRDLSGTDYTFRVTATRIQLVLGVP